jgi:hypothetical protein
MKNDQGSHLSSANRVWSLARSSDTLSRSRIKSTAFPRSFETNGVHCSENLTKLIKADRMRRVRSDVGVKISLPLKSGTFAASARRILRVVRQFLGEM